MSARTKRKGLGNKKATEPGDGSQEMPSPRHSNESQKHGTATEHSMHFVPDRGNDSMELLIFNVKEFLTHVVLACEHLPRIKIEYDDIEDMIFEKTLDWSPHGDNASYSHSDLKLHKKLWDVVNSDKDGAPKDHSFVDWCRRIALHHTESIAANNAATEHDNPYRIMVEDIWANELTPTQKNKPKYKLREHASIPQELRSLVHVILRKNLGDARVASYILEHGIPTLLEPPLLSHPVQRAEMETMLEELMMWHVSLLKWLDERHNDPNTIIARKLSDPNEKQWQADRRHRKLKIEQELRHGAYLANLRDTRTKRKHDMSTTDQRLLEDYDAGKLRKRHDEVRIRKPTASTRTEDHAT